MKKDFKIVLYIIMLFIFFPCVVAAKNLENTCVYSGKYDTDNETKYVTITCKFYDNNTYSKCNIGTTFNQPIENWNNVIGGQTNFSESESAKSWYSNNHSCLPYMVFFDKGALINNYELYAAVDLTRANAIEMIGGTTWGYHTAIAKLQGSTDDDETTDPYQEEKDTINSYINTLNNLVDSFGLDDCLVDGEVSLDPNSYSYYTCINRVKAMYEKFDDYDEYVEKQIDKGIFTEDDELIQEYRAAVKNAKGKIDENLDNAYEGDKTIDVDPIEIDVATDTTDCDGIFSGNFGSMLKQILALIRFAVPILIIGLSTVDFVKSAASQNQDEIKKAANKLVKRLIIGVVIFILPTLLEVILKLADIEYGTCGIR
jgi:hypothetical protein